LLLCRTPKRFARRRQRQKINLADDEGVEYTKLKIPVLKAREPMKMGTATKGIRLVRMVHRENEEEAARGSTRSSNVRRRVAERVTLEPNICMHQYQRFYDQLVH
jgi:hypothetical protein